jgi:hypothetical protein
VSDPNDELAQRRTTKRIARLSADVGLPVGNVERIEVPPDAEVTVVEDFWPSGEPAVFRTYWER